MGDIANWIPTVVTAGAVGTLYFLIRKMFSDFKANIEEKIKMQDEKIQKAEDSLKEYMRTENHIMICQINTQKVMMEFNKELAKWKDETFSFFREFESKFEDKLIALFKQNGFIRKE